MRAVITVLPGDGIGPEVTAEAAAVLEAVAQAIRPRVSMTREALIGGAAIDATGTALPDATLAPAAGRTRCCWAPWAARSGTTRGAKVRPEQGLLAIRKGLGLYANLRPVAVHPQAAAAPRRCAPSCWRASTCWSCAS